MEWITTGELPELKKKRKKREADITPKVMKWFYDNYPHDTAVEVKVDKNKVKPHQLVALTRVKDGTFFYKIPDLGQLNPFDFIVLKESRVHPIIFVYNYELKTFKFKDLKTGMIYKGKLSTSIYTRMLAL